MGDGIHINVQNAKINGSNQQKEENVGFDSNNVFFAFLTLISFWLYRKFFCMKVPKVHVSRVD